VCPLGAFSTEKGLRHALRENPTRLLVLSDRGGPEIFPRMRKNTRRGVFHRAQRHDRMLRENPHGTFAHAKGHAIRAVSDFGMYEGNRGLSTPRDRPPFFVILLPREQNTSARPERDLR
jgi:hypothetical protein